MHFPEELHKLIVSVKIYNLHNMATSFKFSACNEYQIVSLYCLDMHSLLTDGV